MECEQPTIQQATVALSATAGRQICADLWGCTSSLLSDAEALVRMARAAAEQAGATVLSLQCHRFNPQGVTVLAMLAESHLALHTFPESDGLVALDIYTCGTHCHPHLAYDYLYTALGCREATVRAFERGGQKDERRK